MDHPKSGVRDQPGQHGETLSWLKNTKITWVLWCVPVIPATWEAEARESLEPGRWRLRWVEIAPLHSSLGVAVRLYLKKQNKTKQNKTKQNKTNKTKQNKWLPKVWRWRKRQNIKSRNFMKALQLWIFLRTAWFIPKTKRNPWTTPPLSIQLPIRMQGMKYSVERFPLQMATKFNQGFMVYQGIGLGYIENKLKWNTLFPRDAR